MNIRAHRPLSSSNTLRSASLLKAALGNRRFLSASLVLLLVTGTLVAWTLAQPAVSPPPPLDPEVRAELARLAILFPSEFAAEIEKTKTAQEIIADQISAVAILEPAAYATEERQFKTQAQLDAEERSLFAILEPEKYNALVEPLKTPEHLQRETESRHAILNPQLKNGAEPPAGLFTPSQP